MKHLLNFELDCLKCNGVMHRIKATHRLDKYAFYCSICKKYKSLRNGSFLAKFPRLPLILLTRIIYEFYHNGVSAVNAARELTKEGYETSEDAVRVVYQ